jgi:hypothetical protein
MLSTRSLVSLGARASRSDTARTGHVVRSTDGTRIAYLSVGTGPAVLLIPGVLSMAADYAAFASSSSLPHERSRLFVADHLLYPHPGRRSRAIGGRR